MVEDRFGRNFNLFSKIRTRVSTFGMQMNTASWAVVATVYEPPVLVQAFVAWHLALGASEVFIYCDNPDDPVREVLAHLPKVHVQVCDVAHWQRVNKMRPHRHEVRQVCNARDAFARTKAGWLLHSDADEFLWSASDVSQTLDKVSDAADALIVPVAERVHAADDPGKTIFEGVFRRPFRSSHADGLRLFGPDYDLTNRGLTGHAQGKAFSRTGRPLKLSIHRPRKMGAGNEPVFERAAPDEMELLHFEGLTPAHWRYKLGRMMYMVEKRDGMPLSAHRNKQAARLRADVGEADALYRKLKVPSERHIEILRSRGLMTEVGFDPCHAMAACFDLGSYDLEPAAFDAWIDENKSVVAAYLDSLRG